MMGYTGTVMPVDSERPYLVPVYTAERGVIEGPSIRLEVGETVIGRDEGTGILAFPADGLVSRRHARLSLKAEPWRLSVEDLSSKNGTFVNGRKKETAHLVDGDFIRFGESFFVVRWRDRAEDPASDIVGRAPSVRRMRTELDRLNPHVQRVLLFVAPGAVPETVARAIHRRINPEGTLVKIQASDVSMQTLNQALAGTSTLLMTDIEQLPASQAAQLIKADGLAPVIATTSADVDALVYSGSADGPLVALFDDHRIRIPRLAERREDLLGLFFSALGDDLPPPTTDLIETLLLYSWEGGMMELMEVAAELRVRGSGLDALVTELVSPRLRGGFSTAARADDPLTAVEIRRPIPSKPDLEGLMTIHDDDIDAVAEALGRSRMQVSAWVQSYALGDESE
jgi:pSer/pThr/pTyr-binding forkhead associated (FHA) protein